MNNKQITKVFEDIADFLELKGENVFKIRAYQKAARSIEQSSIELEQMVNEDRLKEVPGVGEAIAKKITELVTTGKLEYFEKLKAEFPPGISTLLDIPGIGPKTAMLLSNELDINSIEELEKAILEGKVAQLPRMGEKTADNILRHLRALRRKDQRIPLGDAVNIMDEIFSRLREVPGIKNLTPAGSLRRFKETVGDIDLMGTADNAEAVIDSFVSLPIVKEVLAKGTTKASVIVTSGLQVDLRIVEHEAFGSLLQHFTGSKQHNIDLRERAHRQGLSLSEYGITDIETGKIETFLSEAAFYKRLDLQYIPPEIREGTEEIEKAAKGTIPRLVEVSDIKGEFHVHTDWSDGHDTIESMVMAAKARSYEYICISDHSGGRGIAHGLNKERLEQQVLEINELNRRTSGIRILAGMEVDIRADGSLDMPDDLLKRLDVVTASVHSSMEQTQEKTTARIIQAMENPNVDILAHPTGRLMPNRQAMDIDMEAVFQTALHTGTVLEINAMPDRLDLKDTHIYRARQLGIALVINTDSHSTEHLPLMRFGIGIARRGWCEARDILNTRPLTEVMKYIESKGRK
jgi:DNA polymerase (family 10)